MENNVFKVDTTGLGNIIRTLFEKSSVITLEHDPVTGNIIASSLTSKGELQHAVLALDAMVKMTKPKSA